MRRVVALLPFVSRSLALCALLAGVGAGLLEASLGASLVCFDTCPSRAYYFTHIVPDGLRALIPCLVLEALAIVAFVAYCSGTRQSPRVLLTLLVALVGGVIGVAVLSALAQHAQATLPIWGGDAGDTLREAPLVAWAQQWGWAITLAAGTWSGALLFLQWRR
jgi:hypothetical protein